MKNRFSIAFCILLIALLMCYSLTACDGFEKDDSRTDDSSADVSMSETSDKETPDWSNTSGIADEMDWEDGILET